ncbi:SAM-dependent methyltransferase [Frankia sp. R82]|uniref:SAM-dependent methyltransferase n=1 Tax=Frankia sp. R82 TaxID=2950553 RepID=UPI002043E50E|nr:SAM-dependent methyltransferase [Frankia sp. R82]MCM3884312.1 SAM-dependent methyltransferase [Frankia sp. R82]
MSNPVRDLDVGQPHAARMYDYFLGGKEHFPADREAAEKVLDAAPSVPVMARENRAFMIRAARFLAAEAGIRQFLDIGTGLPTSPNLHEVVQTIAPEARVVYADNDPLVLVHARALLTSTPAGRTAYLDADLRHPLSVLVSDEVRDTLDLRQPVALSLIAILHFLTDADDPYAIVAHLMNELPAGSALMLSHLTADHSPAADQVATLYREQGIPTVARSHDEVTRFFTGLHLIDPGVTTVHRWRPDTPDVSRTDAEVSVYGAVARKA